MIRFFLRLSLLILFAAAVVWGWEKFRKSDWLSGGETVTNHNVVLERITTLGKLELVHYNFRDVVEHEVVRPLLPNAKALLIVQGEAIGCLDLTKVGSADVASFGNDTLIIHLPEPELCSFKIDHSRSKVYNTEYAIFDEANLVDDAFRRAEAQVRESALQAGILEQTRTNADKILKPLLESVSGRKVLLRYRLKADLQRPR
ncbi:MAG: DUF4230 domain-containing protein [Cytophagaceae bacterium]|nr:DUF4230 domain-containing protein [Cytophagaceae bacterium]